MELGYVKIKNEQVFVSEKFLTENFISRVTIENTLRTCPEEANSKYLRFNDEFGTLWYNYSSIPSEHLRKYGLPRNAERLINILVDAVPSGHHGVIDASLLFLFNVIWHIEGHWVKYIPLYRPYYLKQLQYEKLAKTHAVIEFMLKLYRDKSYTGKQLYYNYMQMPHVYFKAGSTVYFYKKMRLFRKNGIQETLMHNFSLYGREPYKIDNKIVALVKRHYISPKRYKVCKIHQLVNLDLISRGMEKISRSTVSKILQDQEFRNKADAIRLGQKHAKNKIITYLSRAEIEGVGELYEMDAKDLHIKVNENGDILRVWLFVILDCATQKIVGYDLDVSENTLMVINSLKMALEQNEIIPENIVYDRHPSVTNSQQYKDLKSRLRDYGSVLRECRARNPGDKGHVERWFGHFADYYLCEIKGYFGSGIKSGRNGSRAGYELDRLYNTKSEMDTLETVMKKVRRQLTRYNNTPRKSEKLSPSRLFNSKKRSVEAKFKKRHGAYLFGIEKEREIYRSKIHIKNEKQLLIYRVDDRKLANKINNTKVKVYYHFENPSYAYLYNLQKQYLGKVHLENRLSAIPKTGRSEQLYQTFYIKNVQDLLKSTNEVFEEIEQGTVDLEVSTVHILDEEIQRELDELKAEDFELVSKTMVLSKPHSKSSLNLFRDRGFNIYKAKKKKSRRTKN